MFSFKTYTTSWVERKVCYDDFMIKKLSRSKVTVITTTVIAIIVGFFIFQTYSNRPNLGTHFEYLGSKQTGCPLPLPLGYVLLCSAGPSEDYYFATDLNAEELNQYFNNVKTEVNEPRKYPSVEEDEEGRYLELVVQNSNRYQGFRVTYYDKKDLLIKKNGLRETSRHFLISIPSNNNDLLTAQSLMKQ